MESLHKPEKSFPDYDFEDYVDASFYDLLCQMPRELGKRHLSHIVINELSDEEAAEYLRKILTERREATMITVISDSHARELLEAQETDFFRQIETSVFTDLENQLGSGMTAKVKRFAITQADETLPIAIKYLVTPNANTVSAAAEHNMIKEVERIKEVEELEKGIDFKYIAVPHPYFHHKTSSLQCYGMQLIDGPDLKDGLTMMETGQIDNTTLETWAQLEPDAIDKEIDVFFTRMHTYCLHGDIKSKNLMLDKAGKLYIIDFGQSVLAMDVDDKSRDHFDHLKEKEIIVTKKIIRDFIRKAKAQLANME